MNIGEQLVLYAVTDRSFSEHQSFIEQVEAALQGGVTMLQLREKDLVKEELYQEAVVVHEVCQKYKVPMIIDDDVELALEIGAAGVHVGQKDMDAKIARQMIGPDRILGVTAHSVEEAIRAEQNGADYLGVGAVFPTTSKKDTVDMPIEKLREICDAVHIPVVAIGGINGENIEKLKGSHIAGAAVIRGIFGAEDVKGAAQYLYNESKKIVEER